LDKERAYLVATPFKKRGKKSLKVSDFIFTISLDLKWGPPDKVRALLLEAEKEGMICLEGDMVHASFEEDEVEVPIGFKPQAEESLFDRAVRLITSNTGMGRKEVIALVNERQDSLQRLVDLDAVVLLVAREMGLDVREMAIEAYRQLLEGDDRSASSTATH